MSTSGPSAPRAFRQVDSDLEIDDDDFDIDESMLRHVDNLESAYTTSKAAVKAEPHAAGGSRVKGETAVGNNGVACTKQSIPDSDDFDFGSDDVLTSTQLAALEQLDAAAVTRPQQRDFTEIMRNQAGPSSRPMQRIASRENIFRAPAARSNARTKGAGGSTSKQLTLFGDEIAEERAPGLFIQARGVNEPTASQAPSSSKGIHSSRLSQAQRPFLVEGHRFHEGGDQRAKTKQWDFAQPVVVKRKPAFAEYDLDDDLAAELLADADEDLDDDSVEFVRPPNPLAPPPIQGLSQMKVRCDREAARTWVYPTNKERRDYQFNIVQRALFNNVLVALPTGLGKTFIAAVVILNYFRWFPNGKIIFVAPTKPLVSQQQVACHGICGLPWEVACEMTGEVKAQQRAEEWKVKRIFYMTPQTFENDLCSDLVNAEDIVCVVVDEAHHATGNYAYGKVIRHLMPRNPFFRVLALTATPGSRPEQVQEVIDSLHINYIEIRSEASLDIRKYIRSKDEDQVVVAPSSIVKDLRDRMVQLMRPSFDTLQKAGLLWAKDPALLQPFAVMAIYQDPRKKAIVNAQRLFQHVSDLGALARAMEMLIRYSVNMFASRMFALETGSDPAARGKKATQTRQRKKYSGNTIVRDLRRIYEDAQDSEGVVMHPKMEYLQNVICAHFAKEEESGRSASDTRVMVFCSLRECVTELVTILNRVKGVSATVFVGQSSDSKGNKGMTQKDQERIVREFKSGKINVLVATSIGEEGLDIGEVDLIVNYEAVKNSTRMLQRDGRTGRKRDGRIVTLMAEGLEESNWQRSKDNYKSMQDDIIKGVNLQLFDDVERLVPDDISTEPIFQEVEQPEFEPSLIRMNSRPKKGPVKRKRDSNPKRNVPKDAFNGFVKVSNMRKGKGTSKRKKRDSIREADDESSSDDDQDLSAAQAGPSARPDFVISDSSDDDADDELLSRGIVASDFASSSKSKSASSSSPRQQGTKTNGRSLGAGRPRPAAKKPRNIESSSPLLQRGPLQDTRLNAVRFTAIDSSLAPKAASKGKAVQLPDTDESSPVVLHRRGAANPLLTRLAADEAVLNGADPVGPAARKNGLDLDDDSDSDIAAPAPAKKAKRKLVRATELARSSSPGVMGPPAPRLTTSRDKRPAKKAVTAKTGPSEAPRKKRVGNSPTSRRLFAMEADRSTDEEIHGERDENDEGDDRWIEDSSDREHVGDFAPTQAVKGYNQAAVYMQSTHTQLDTTPFTKHAQMLRRRRQASTPHSARRGRNGAADDSGSSAGELEPDEYENDSFICSDNESIAYASQRSASGLDSSQW